MLLTVGPGQQFSTIAAAIAASHNGDTIQVQAGTYTNDFASINTDITLEGVGGMVNMVSTEEIPNGKGILVTNGNDTINNFSFSGAYVAPSDANGAGIRDQAGNLVLNHDYFFNNQNGLLGGAAGSTITINYCEFANNGVSDPNSAGYGYTHNLYVSNVTTLTINNSYFHGANIGHEIKSRALNTTIQNSRIHDGPTGTASYSIDLPNGGNALIENNVLEKGPLSQNRTIISFGEEGGVYASSSLQITGNQILNDLSSASALAVNNRTSVTAQITGNQFFGLTANQIAAGPNTQSDNLFLATEPTLIITHPWDPSDTSPPAVSPGDFGQPTWLSFGWAATNFQVVSNDTAVAGAVGHTAASSSTAILAGGNAGQAADMAFGFNDISADRVSAGGATAGMAGLVSASQSSGGDAFLLPQGSTPPLVDPTMPHGTVFG